MKLEEAVLAELVDIKVLFMAVAFVNHAISAGLKCTKKMVPCYQKKSWLVGQKMNSSMQKRRHRWDYIF